MPLVLMLAVGFAMTGLEHTLSAYGKTISQAARLAGSGVAIRQISVAATGFFCLYAMAGCQKIRAAGCGVLLGCLFGPFIAWALTAGPIDAIQNVASVRNLSMADIHPAAMIGTASLILVGCFAMRVSMSGNAAFRLSGPKRVHGKRALHGEARWMSMKQASRLFHGKTGIVVGECYRVDEDGGGFSIAGFRPRDANSWGRGGKAPLLIFDGSFGSSHGLVFAGSGGYKTSSVTIPTALTWDQTLIVLDPSNEVAPLVSLARQLKGRRVFILDPRRPTSGFNALDWIGRFGGSKEEDIASVASWIMSDNGRPTGLRDDFFRASAQQLLTAMIADVCLSGHTPPDQQTLRQVRRNLSEPEPQLRKRLQEIYDHSVSDFVRENVAAFVNMTPETFSGVYANTIKETHWLSYPNYAALVSGFGFSTDDVASGHADVFINVDLKTLENHAGLARVIIGSLLNAISNRPDRGSTRALFLLDEAARLGHMRILETARDTGRKYGITLTLIYQSLGQLRETYGGRDASSKWFESASWISFAAINDPETADYISRRAGMTTVEIDQLTRSSQTRGMSRTRSKQLAPRPLILPHEVLLMRADEQIIFTAGNPPLRCGRAIWFRRPDMKAMMDGVRGGRNDVQLSRWP